MNSLLSQALLMLTAFIWGTAFVAQKGLLVLGIFYHFFGKRKSLFGAKNIRCGTISGLFLFAGATLQQIGIQYTTTGKAGFITGLYVVLVPLLSIFLGKKAGKQMWVGCLLSFLGLYLLAVSDYVGQINVGDFLIFLSAIFFTFHVVSVGFFLESVDALELSLVQYAVCGLLSFAFALMWESVTIGGVKDCFWAIFYGGVLSVGVAYTLQIVGQKNVEPTPAAIILSLETVFAALGGYIILGEGITPREQIGCVFMLTGIVVSQIKVKIKS